MSLVRVAVAFSVLAAVALAASAAEWKTHTFAADGFAADFSGEVETHVMDVTKSTRERLVSANSHTQMSKGGRVGFLVAANHFADGEVINFNAIARRTLKSYACKKIVDDARIEVAGIPAREMRATDCYKGTNVGARFLKRDQWFYQVVYLIVDEEDRADGERFLASFKLVPVKN